MLKNRVPGPENEANPLHPGERTNGEGKPVANTILLSIPDEEFNAIRQDLQYLELPLRTVLYEARKEDRIRPLLEFGDDFPGV